MQQITEMINLASKVKRKDSLTRVHKGNLLVIKGELDSAIHEYNSVLKEEANFVPALLSLASAYVQKEDFKSALVYFQKVLSRSPEMTPDIRLSIGFCYYELKRTPQARYAYTRALERVFYYVSLIFHRILIVLTLLLPLRLSIGIFRHPQKL
jgi:RNA polymerase-associated protein CTR9